MDSGTGPVLRAQLIADGYREQEVRRLHDRRGLVSVRPGAYVDAADERLTLPEARHALEVRAAVDQGVPGVVSHVSAAVLHGLAVWSVPLDRVHVTRPGQSGGRRTRHLHVHMAPLDDEEVESRDGIVVTSAATTVVDLARTLPFEQAVVIADSALSLGVVVPAALARVLQSAGRRHGNAAAARVLAFADGRAESPGESRSRVAISRAGLPTPQLQWAVCRPDGSLIGRSDFGWPAQRVLGEFDGRVKYGRLLRPGQEAGDVVYAEKLREDALRDLDNRVVRWGWVDLDPFDHVARRLGRALGVR